MPVLALFFFNFFNVKTANQKFPKLAMQILLLSHALCQVLFYLKGKQNKNRPL